MAQGDVVVFNEAKLSLLDGTHDLDTHTIKVAICDNTAAPTATSLVDGVAFTTLFTEVGNAGSYTTGGDAITISLTESAGTVKFDSADNPTWAQNASNDTDAYWGIIYNTQSVGVANEAIAYVDLGGPIDMSAGTLTINWNANGIFTLA